MNLTEQPELVQWPETHYVFVEKTGPYKGGTRLTSIGFVVIVQLDHRWVVVFCADFRSRPGRGIYSLSR